MKRQDFEYYAKMCPEYNPADRSKEQITVLINKYCDARQKYIDAKDDDTRDEADYDKSRYISALILKFWDQAYRMYDKVKTAGETYEDCQAKLYERIEYACKYRKWQTDPKTSAQACINQAISTEILNIFYFANMDKYKANAAVNKTSIDAKIDDSSDTTFADTIVDTDRLPSESFDESINIIQTFVDDDRVVEAIILDTMATQDCMKHTSKTVKYTDLSGKECKRVKTTSEFWPHRCVQYLQALPKDYVKYFSDKYAISDTKLDAALKSIRSASANRLSEFVDYTRLIAQERLS